MARLLYLACERPIAPEYAGQLLAAFEFEAKDKSSLPATKEALPSPVGVLGPQPGTVVEALSEREREVLQLIAQGLTNREIAQRLFVSLSTVKRHTANIYGKLGVHNRTHAVAYARSLGILRDVPPS